MTLDEWELEGTPFPGTFEHLAAFMDDWGGVAVREKAKDILTSAPLMDEIQCLERELAHERAKLAETTGLLAQARAKWERSLELRRGTVEALREARRERDAALALVQEPEVISRLLEAAHAWRLAARVGRPGEAEADALYEAIVAWEALE